jgi:hypothetical protein
MADYVVSGFNKTTKGYEALTLAGSFSVSSGGELQQQDATAAQDGLMTQEFADKLDNVEALADVTDETNVLTALANSAAAKDMGGGAITNVGLVDGRDVGTDGGKLDGIEGGADITDETNVLAALANSAAAKDMGGGAISNVGLVDGRDVGTDGGKLDGIEALADVTDATNVSAAGALMESLYDAQSVIVAVLDNSPVKQTVGDSEFVGRPSGGDVGVMTAVQARTVLNVEDGADATDFDNVKTALAAATSAVDFNGQALENIAAPTNDTDAARWGEVKDAIAAIDRHEAARYASVANYTDAVFITSSIYLESNDPGFAALTVDGQTPDVGDRILFKDLLDYDSGAFQFASNPFALSDYLGEYITVYEAPGDTARYYWFQTTGADPDPTPGGVGTEIDIQAAANNVDVASLVATGINGTNNLNCQVGSADFGTDYIKVGCRLQGAVSDFATTDGTNIPVSNRTYGGSSAGNMIATVTTQGNGIDTNWRCDIATDWDYSPSSENAVGDTIFVSEGDTQNGTTHTQITVPADTEHLELLWDVNNWTLTGAGGVYTGTDGVIVTGTEITADLGTGMTLDGTSIVIDYTVEHIFSNLDISTVTNWQLGGVAFADTSGGGMNDINKLTGGEFSDVTDLHIHSHIGEPSNFLTRQNVLVGQLVVKANEGSGDGWYLCDATDLELSVCMGVSASAELAGTAIDVYLTGHQIPVLMDKDHSGGSPGDAVCHHPSRPGYATMAADFGASGYYNVIGYLTGTKAAGGGVTDELANIDREKANESRIFLGP